ncbi:MAG: DUF2461 domain-containing protein [Actinomycetota bacterium]|jgi:uncharacterized protein (TIGR02453 family)
MGFTGFSDDAFGFYERLGADNTRAFWQANKADYQQYVRGPMDALLAALAAFGPFHVFRPYKDVRFAKDKTPYKDHIGAYGESEGGAGHYVQLSASGMFVGSGYYDMATDQLDRLRRAIDADATGAEIVRLVAELERRGHTITAMSALKTAPRGYPKDHPRIGLLRLKGLVATREWPVSSWMHTRAAVKRIADTWTAAGDLDAWLDTHVGPSTLAPDDGDLARFGPL